MSAELPLWQCVDLERVTLAQCAVRSTVDPDHLPADPVLHLDVNASATHLADTQRLVCLVRLLLRGEAQAESSALFSVDVEYRVTYRLRPGCAPSAAQLEEFAGQNGVFNAWPYLREFVQSMYYRLELPLPPLPSFTVGAAAGGADAPEGAGPRAGEG
jgi:preprotein translocase subunit SecB